MFRSFSLTVSRQPILKQDSELAITNFSQQNLEHPNYLLRCYRAGPESFTVSHHTDPCEQSQGTSLFITILQWTAMTHTTCSYSIPVDDVTNFPRYHYFESSTLPATSTSQSSKISPQRNLGRNSGRLQASTAPLLHLRKSLEIP